MNNIYKVKQIKFLYLPLCRNIESQNIDDGIKKRRYCNFKRYQFSLSFDIWIEFIFIYLFFITQINDYNARVSGFLDIESEHEIFQPNTGENEFCVYQIRIENDKVEIISYL
jgi:hypothetical protein